MSFLKRFFSIVALLALASCGGGGGDAGTCPFTSNCGGGGGGTATVSTIDIAVSSATMPNTGSGSVTVTVTALDSNRNGVPNANVSLSASSGLLTLLGTSGSVTGETGALGATLTLGGDLSAPRTITLTAAANGGAITRTTTVSVVPSVSGATPASIELVASNTELGTGGEQVTISAFVKDANNNAMASTPISFSTNTGTLTSLSALTSSTGTASAVLAAGADKSNRDAVVTVVSGAITNTITVPIRGTTITLSGPSSLVLGQSANFDVSVRDSKSNIVTGVTITPTSLLGNTFSVVSSSGGTTTYRYTATTAGTDTLSFNAAGAVATSNVVISSEDFAFIFPTADTKVPVNTAQLVQVRLRRNGVAQVGTTINFAATGGTLSASSVLTDANGVGSVELTSASAGPVTVQATVSGTATTSTLPLLVVATAPSKLVLQVTPTAIAPNTTPESQNQAQVVAKVTDAAANPVAGVVVNFTRVIDPSGGNLLQASATTDSNGQATVIYRSGAESTASNGVTLRGTVASAPAVTGTATLTVNQQSLFIALGTGNTITNVDPQTYKQDWTIYVTDANGVPVNGATLTLKAIPDRYITGNLVWSGRVWVPSTNIRYCRNEDANKNGVLDPGEDDNTDGVLWPGNVIAVSPSSVQTVNGRATVSLTYAETYVPWIELRLTATASVAGTESKTDALFVVTGLASDFNQETVPPAGVSSPFGLTPKTGAVCTP